MVKLNFLLGVIGFTFCSVLHAGLIGSASDHAAFSAKQILNDNPLALDGIYWIDSDGAGGNAAFQVFADMTADGGGWTQGLLSLNGDKSSTTDMVSNTGLISGGHTRDVSHLAIDQNAQIRHILKDVNGQTLFDGFYTGNYHGTMGQLADWTMLAGDISLLSYHFGKDWSTASNDVDDSAGNCAVLYSNPWYHGNCWVGIPSQTRSAYPTDAPVLHYDGSYQRLGSWSIMVRELTTPAFTHPNHGTQSGAIPEPSIIFLFAGGLAGLGFVRSRKR